MTTIYASVDVIRKTAGQGCNFIIVHESLFWNHEDHTDLMENSTAFQKKKPLDQYGICVWHNHDYMHAGVRIGNMHRDAAMYGMCEMLG